MPWENCKKIFSKRAYNMRSLFSKLGPGILYAGAAVGVSHLIQSTKAGSMYGLQLLGFVIIANIIKYPFFEFSTRYTLASGNTLLEGYQKMGKWALYLFLGVTFSTMFTIQGAVTFVTATLLKSVFSLQFDTAVIAAIVLTLCLAIIWIGRYGVLDNLMKGIILILSVTTIVAATFAYSKVKAPILSPLEFHWEGNHITFLIALIGWMPAPFDISVWQSEWTNEKLKLKELSVKDGLLDFKVGYWLTMFLAVIFLFLGAFTTYSEAIIPEAGGAFIDHLLNLYTSSIGKWSYPIIAMAAITTMFSTTLTCFDAFPRVLEPCLNLIHPQRRSFKFAKQSWLMLIAIGAILLVLHTDMGLMIKIATILSFTTAPIIAYLNFMAVKRKEVPNHWRPKGWYSVTATISLILLSGFTIYYLIREISNAIDVWGFSL